MVRSTVIGLLASAALLLTGCRQILGLDDLPPRGDASGDATGSGDAPGGLAPVHESYVKASNTGQGDAFGGAVALSADGSTLAIAATSEDSLALGIDGNQADNNAMSAGAVYVFARSGSTWVQQAYVKASNTNGGDNFGSAIALSADGSTLAVGASGEDSNATTINGDPLNNFATGAGAVYVFTRSGTTWTQEAYVKASNTGGGDGFGSAVALSSDGSMLAVGAPSEDSNAQGIGGNQADNNATAAGAVYVFTRSGTTWSQDAYVKASNTGVGDNFGSAVALSSDGATLAVSAPDESSSATTINGNELDNSATGAGAVYVFARAAPWSQEAYVKPSNTGTGDGFGTSVALAGDGSTLAVGAPGEDSNATGVGGDPANNMQTASGATYVFARAGTTWSEAAYVKATNTGQYDGFGSSVALAADAATLIVGATSEDSNATGFDGAGNDNSAMNAGAAYAYLHQGGAWLPATYIKASNTGADDRFGADLAISGDGRLFVVTATDEDSNATGIGGDQANNSLFGAGAGYVIAVP